MTNVALHNGRLILASAVFAAGLALTGTAFAQVSTGGSGSATNPATSGAGSSNSGTPCEKGCGPTAGQSDAQSGTMMQGGTGVQTGNQNMAKDCTPGSTVSANAGTTTCVQPDGSKVFLPNQKGNGAK